MGGPQQGDFGQNDRQSPDEPEGDENRTPPADGENSLRGPMNGQQPSEKPEGNEPPANDLQPPEKPEGSEDRTPPEKPENDNQTLSQDEQGMFRLFQQFLEWLKGSSAA